VLYFDASGIFTRVYAVHPVVNLVHVDLICAKKALTASLSTAQSLLIITVEDTIDVFEVVMPRHQ